MNRNEVKRKPELSLYPTITINQFRTRGVVAAGLTPLEVERLDSQV